jgi:hypothetical protein
MCLPHTPYKIEREWIHAGLRCAVTQAREAEHRCGYVRVPPGHPLYGKSYDDDDFSVNAHGGVNFSEKEPCTEHEDGQGWWFGFDCGHCFDGKFDPKIDPALLSPQAREIRAIYERCNLLNEHYWTQPEVEAEVERLADQLAEIAQEAELKSVGEVLKAAIE